MHSNKKRTKYQLTLCLLIGLRYVIGHVIPVGID